MKEKHDSTADPQLSNLLRAARVAPPMPPRFAPSVWHRIEKSEAPATSATWLDALATLILRPRFALSTAAALLLAGVFLGSVAGWQTARQEAQLNYLTAVAPHFVH